MAKLFRILIPFLFLVSATAAQQTVMSTKEHDFGVVRQGQKLVYVFSIRSAGDASLRIDRVESSLPGISARFQPVIPPGGEGKITVEWNTTEAVGPQDGTLTVRTSDPAQPNLSVHIKADVRPAIEFLPYPAAFFTAYEDETPEKSIRIINNGENPLDIEDIEFPENHYSVALDTVEPGRIYELRIKIQAGVPLGRYMERIMLTTNDPQNARLVVGANLFVKPDFYAFPEVIDFGSVSLEMLDRQPNLLSLLTQTAILSNRTGPLEVRSVATDLSFLRFSRSPEKGKDSRFRLDVIPIRERMQRGKITGNIHVFTDDPQHRELIIPVQGEVN